MRTIDLNADLGEGMSNDAALLDIVSSANIACGGHAGDDETMRRTLVTAHEKSVACGAHPGFIDKEHFGRTRLNLSSEELTNQIQSQLSRLVTIAAQEGVPVRYLKLHGALANMAAEDEQIAKTAFAAASRLHPGLAILALDNSAQVTAAKALGLPVIREAYADRAYTASGLLVARNQKGAVLTDPKNVIRQCLQLATKGTITALDGSTFKSAARSLCIHCDTPDALALAQMIRAKLLQAGIEIRPEFK